MDKPENNRRKKSSKKTPSKTTFSSRKKAPKKPLPKQKHPRKLQPKGVVEPPKRRKYVARILTLLNIPERKKLPQKTQHQQGKRSRLETIVLFDPDLYKTFLARIAAGTSFNVASEIIGISQRQFYAWCYKGKEDLENEDDTYYSRFMRDIYTAAARATGDAEEEVKRLDPKVWLSRGAGRIFGNAWAKDQREAKRLASDAPSGNASHLAHSAHADSDQSVSSLQERDPSEAIDVVFSTSPTKSLPAPDDNEQPVNPNRLIISPENELATLKVLESIGEIKLSDTLVKAFQMQIANSENEDDPSEAKDEDNVSN